MSREHKGKPTHDRSREALIHVAHLGEHCGRAKVVGSNPVRSLEFFPSSGVATFGSIIISNWALLQLNDTATRQFAKEVFVQKFQFGSS